MQNTKISVTFAAELMNKCPQFVREGLKRGILPIGHAYKISEDSSQYTYYISPKLFKDYTGIDAIEILNEERRPL